MQSFPPTSRAAGTELLDAAEPDARMAADEFRFLRRLNAVCTAGDAVADAVARAWGPGAGTDVSVVDFGGGTAEIGRAFLRAARRRDWRPAWLATDRSDAVLALARAVGEEGLAFARADLLDAVRAVGARTHDVAHASLVLHHLADADVVRALHQMGTVARRLVVWNDLLREPLGVLGARMMTLGASPTLRHDAVLSVRRGFTMDEASAFAEAAGLRVRDVRRWRNGPRFVLVADAADGPVPVRRPVIRATDVCVRFGACSVLERVSLQVGAGQVVALVGANGAGKTTLLRTLAGARPPQSGRAWCDRAFAPVGYLPQHGGLVAGLDAHANVAFALEASGWPAGRRDAAVRAALDAFGVVQLGSTRVDRMSVGQARRVALAAAFAPAPAALLLDEPEAGLDADGRARLAAAIVAAAQRGAGVLVVTHEPGALQAACTAAGVAFASRGVDG